MAIYKPNDPLGPSRMCQPDCLGWIRQEFGGSVRTDRTYVTGPPDLAIEVAAATREDDLGPQLKEFQFVGVPEYIVFTLDPDEIYWHVLEQNHYVLIDPDADGIYRSRIFPGLWLDVKAFWNHDGLALLAALDRGLASPEHAEFVARLEQAKQTKAARD